MLTVLGFTIVFGLGFLAGRIDRSGRRQDRLADQRVAAACFGARL